MSLKLMYGDSNSSRGIENLNLTQIARSKITKAKIAEDKNSEQGHEQNESDKKLSSLLLNFKHLNTLGVGAENSAAVPDGNI